MPHDISDYESSEAPCDRRRGGNIVPFLLKGAAATASVTALCRRLGILGRAPISDEATADRIIDAQLAAVAALGRVPASDLDEVVGKLEVVVRGIDDGDGWASSDQMALLRSVLVDLGRLASVGRTSGRLMTFAECDPMTGTTP